MTIHDRAAALQGARAGFVTRVIAAAIDVALVFGVLVAIQALVGALRFAFSDEPYELPDLSAAANSSFLLLLLLVVLSVAWSGSGRTVGSAVVGLRVVRDDGGSLSWPRALARAVVVVGFTVISMGWILVSRKNAGLHDLVCRTAVIYDWRPRPERTRPARSDSRRHR